MSSVVVVTDSTAMLPAELAVERGIVVVPLQVVIGGDVFDEDAATSEMVAGALRARTTVSTSRPTPSALLEVYERAAREGATGILSIHISGDMSGTFESAQLAARDASVPVVTIDSRQVGIATGFAVLAAVDVLDAGGSVDEAADAARSRAAGASSLFYVDTLEYLRRGGRMGAAAALVGSALAVKPILTVDDGRVGPFEKVRTSAKALSRLEELAVEAAGDAEVDVAVAHLASPERARQLAARLGDRLEKGLQDREVSLGEIGAVLGAHVGPGMVAVAVARRS